MMKKNLKMSVSRTLALTLALSAGFSATVLPANAAASSSMPAGASNHVGTYQTFTTTLKELAAQRYSLNSALKENPELQLILQVEGNFTLSKNDLPSNLKHLKLISDGEKPVIIRENFLAECIQLRSIDLKGLSNVTCIWDYFLAGCSGLSSIDLTPLANVTCIWENFLIGCSQLRSIDLTPLANVTFIGSSCLDDCRELSSIALPFAGLKVDNLCFQNLNSESRGSLFKILSSADVMPALDLCVKAKAFELGFHIAQTTKNHAAIAQFLPLMLDEPILNMSSINSTLILDYIAEKMLSDTNTLSPQALINIQHIFDLKPHQLTQIGQLLENQGYQEAADEWYRNISPEYYLAIANGLEEKEHLDDAFLGIEYALEYHRLSKEKGYPINGFLETVKIMSPRLQSYMMAYANSTPLYDVLLNSLAMAQIVSFRKQQVNSCPTELREELVFQLTNGLFLGTSLFGYELRSKMPQYDTYLKHLNTLLAYDNETLKDAVGKMILTDQVNRSFDKTPELCRLETHIVQAMHALAYSHTIHNKGLRKLVEAFKVSLFADLQPAGLIQAYDKKDSFPTRRSGVAPFMQSHSSQACALYSLLFAALQTPELRKSLKERYAEHDNDMIFTFPGKQIVCVKKSEAISDGGLNVSTNNYVNGFGRALKAYCIDNGDVSEAIEDSYMIVDPEKNVDHLFGLPIVKQDTITRNFTFDNATGIISITDNGRFFESIERIDMHTKIMSVQVNNHHAVSVFYDAALKQFMYFDNQQGLTPLMPERILGYGMFIIGL